MRQDAAQELKRGVAEEVLGIVALDRPGGDPADHRRDVLIGAVLPRSDPVEDVETADGVFGRDAVDRPAVSLRPDMRAVVLKHRKQLGRGIEHDGVAGPGQQHRDHRSGGLEAARSGEDEAVGRSEIAVEAHQRFGAAGAPGFGIGGQEHAAGGFGVHVGAVQLAEDQGSILREGASGGFHGRPFGIAVGGRFGAHRLVVSAHGPLGPHE